jgi:prepilin-type processing-associated H-X9-DG protein
MSIEAILRLILLAAAILALIVALAAYKSAANSRARMLLGVLVTAWVVVTLGGGMWLTPKIGPLVRTEGLLLALAPVGALFGGLTSGKRKAVGLNPVLGIVGFGVLVLIDLEAFYHLNHSLAEVAGELGIGTGRKKYEPTANKDCPENLKSLYFAFAQYVDGNGSLPAAEKWMDNDEIASKVQKEEWFHCPDVSNRHDGRYGYAYNDAVAGRAMNGKKLSAFPDAAHTPLLYDSSNLAKSAHDAFASLPKPGRHGGRNNILYCDGHVEAR